MPIYGRSDSIVMSRQRDGAARDAQRPGDLTVGGATFVFEPQDLSYSSHRHPLGWHRSPARHCRDEQSAEHRPTVGRLPPLQGWPTSNRNGRDQIRIGGRLPPKYATTGIARITLPRPGIIGAVFVSLELSSLLLQSRKRPRAVSTGGLMWTPIVRQPEPFSKV
jgi:hypothetical protein